MNDNQLFHAICYTVRKYDAHLLDLSIFLTCSQILVVFYDDVTDIGLKLFYIHLIEETL